jgi:NADH-quinone oxidoreductase subunit A
MHTQVSEFGIILLFLIGAIIFIAGGLITSWIIRPNRPNEEKLTTYECGEETVGNAWGQFNIRFYVVALLFILFDVEIVFLFPWATVFAQQDLIAETGGAWGWFSLIEMTLFIAILALGLAYAWAKGLLEWVRPRVIVGKTSSKVPEHLYEQINQKYAN